MFGNHESQTCTAELSGGGTVALGKRLEQGLKPFAGNSDAGVAYAEPQPGAWVLGSEREGRYGKRNTAPFGELDGIGDKV